MSTTNFDITAEEAIGELFFWEKNNVMNRCVEQWLFWNKPFKK